jgi:hypothetical protein
MKKLLMSGKCRLGYAGESTELFDSYGKPLFTGDLVALSAYNENNPDQFEDYYGVEFVCNNEFQDNGLDKKIFVMGIASEHYMYYDGEETIVCQNHKKWRLRKVKGYENLVDGEEWGAVRVVFEY